MSDRDILEAMHQSGSQRYKPSNGQARTSAATLEDTRVPVQRASRTAEQPLVRRTIDYADDEPTTNVPRRTQGQPLVRRTADYQQRRTIDTNADVQVAPSVRRLRDEKVQPTRKLPEQHQGLRFHWLMYVGAGMVVMLVVWILFVQIIVAWTNGVYTPSHYTQTAHLDVATVITDVQGHQGQVRAFLDAQGHLDLLVLPMGDTSKAHVIVGPTLLFHHLDHVTVTVTARGSVATVLAQGPLEANYLATAQDSSTWIFDLKQPATNKGGH